MVVLRVACVRACMCAYGCVCVCALAPLFGDAAFLDGDRYTLRTFAECSRPLLTNV